MVEKNKGKGNSRRNKNRRKREDKKRQNQKTPAKVSYHREPVIEKPKIPQGKEATTCPICGKTVNDLYTAIAHKQTGEPTHLNCIIQELGKEEKLEKNESLCYIGSGSFGIIEKIGDGKLKIQIKKRIQYVEKHTNSFKKNKCEDDDEQV
jgi:hypothetical protein